MQLLDGRTYAFQWDSNIYVVLPKANAVIKKHLLKKLILGKTDTTVC